MLNLTQQVLIPQCHTGSDPIRKKVQKGRIQWLSLASYITKSQV